MKTLLVSAVAVALLAAAPPLAFAQHDAPYPDSHGKKRQKADRPDRAPHGDKGGRRERRAAVDRAKAAPAHGAGVREKAERDPARRKYDRDDLAVKYGRGDASAYGGGGPAGGYAREPAPRYEPYGVPPKYERDSWRRKYDRDDIPVKYYAEGRGWRDDRSAGDRRDAAWRSGDSLPRSYASGRYAIDDYGALGLDAPPRGYRWVRNGDDAILVNRRTGLILEVQYGVFD